MSEKKVRDDRPDEQNENIENQEEAGTSDENSSEKAPGAQGEVNAAELSKEDEDMQTKYLRLAADFQNFKRRTEKEKSDIYAYANEKIVTELLDVIDNFERAIAHQDDCTDKNLAEGMTMIFKQLKGVLDKSGVKEIAALGEDFDPNLHHAVMAENSEEYGSGKVTMVLQKGYTLNGKVIRAAMVKVAE